MSSHCPLLQTLVSSLFFLILCPYQANDLSMQLLVAMTSHRVTPQTPYLEKKLGEVDRESYNTCVV